MCICAYERSGPLHLQFQCGSLRGTEPTRRHDRRQVGPVVLLTALDTAVSLRRPPAQALIESTQQIYIAVHKLRLFRFYHSLKACVKLHDSVDPATAEV